MKSKNAYFQGKFKTIFYIIFLGSILLIQSKLRCEPDFKSYGDNYNCDQSDYQDSREYFYGYEFAHRAGTDEYYDKWKGVYWDAEQFCYKAYTNDSRPEKLDDLGPYNIKPITVISNNEEPPSDGSDYVMINHDDTNLVDLHKKVCNTEKIPPSNFSYGDYELLLRMDKTFEDDYLKSPHHFYFTVENPSNENVTFAFKVRNFVNTTEEMYANVSDWIINQDCVTTTPATTPPAPTTPPPTPPTSPSGDEAEKDKTSDEIDITEPENVPTTEPEKTPTTEPATTEPPCEWYILNYTDVFWSEEYAIPEVFYLTQNYTIEPHSSMKINLSLTFEENKINTTEGGYFVISSETGQSDKPFYWPEIIEKDNGKLKKLTNMEIILESDLEVGISTFSLMRRKENIDQSYLGDKCNVDTNQGILNGKCEDGFVCNSPTNGTKCEQCEKFQCKECDTKSGKCTKCFLISVEGQWNPVGGSKKYLDCDLDYSNN